MVHSKLSQVLLLNRNGLLVEAVASDCLLHGLGQITSSYLSCANFCLQGVLMAYLNQVPPSNDLFSQLFAEVFGRLSKLQQSVSSVTTYTAQFKVFIPFTKMCTTTDRTRLGIDHTVCSNESLIFQQQHSGTILCGVGYMTSNHVIGVTWRKQREATNECSTPGLTTVHLCTKLITQKHLSSLNNNAQMCQVTNVWYYTSPFK